MNKTFNGKDMINRYIEFMNDELIKYNTKFFEHWSDLSEEMKISFREDFGEDTCKRFNYFVVIWNTDWNNWSVYLADDVFELMDLANCIVKYYYKEDFENLTGKLLQVQEIILKYAIGGNYGKKNQSWGVTSQQVKSQGRTFAKAAS